MKKIAVVYWSGTGNTEAMAGGVAEGILQAGMEAQLLQACEFGAGDLAQFDGVAFGCPAMGAEVLEETEFAPMFEACESGLAGKAVALFGSYGWGDGQWMADWAAQCKADGAVLVADPVICMDAPDKEALEACKKLGAAFA